MEIRQFVANPSVWGIGLAVLFGIIWLAPLAPVRLKHYSTWLVFLGGAVIFAPVIAEVQVPLQNAVSNFLVSWLNPNVYASRILFTGIPLVLISGLVQEGARLLPVVVYKHSQGGHISSLVGLTMGAMAGAGLGIFEAQWINNLILASGWSLDLIPSGGFLSIAGFWERFFSVGFHISIGALTGWGLAKGWGWQAYLVASLIHGFSNYSTILLQTGRLTVVQTEIFIAVVAVILFGAAMWLRWKVLNPPL